MIVPWLEHFWEQIISAFDQKRLAHALLISGSAGLGKYAFATALAQKILCVNKESEACTQCQSCLWFQAHSHPDFFLISPEEEKKQISIAQIRELTESLTKTPYGTYQVVIIYPAETMNRAAANALLKTLEEPNGQIILLLVSDHPASLLPTIRSRCIEYRAQQPPVETAVSWLYQQLNALPETVETMAPKKRSSSKKELPDQTASVRPSAKELLALADGLPVRALGLAQTREWEQHQLIAKDFVRFLSGKLSILKVAELWSKQSPLLVFNILSSILADMIRLISGLSHSEIQHQPLIADLQHLIAQSQSEHLWFLMKKVTEAKGKLMTSANPNIQLLLESVLFSYRSTGALK